MLSASLKEVLVVEDDAEIGETLEAWLSNAGVTVYRASTASDAWALLKQRGFDAILMDLALGDERGDRLIPWLRSGPGPNRHTPILVVSGGVDLRFLQAIQPHINAVLLKPFTAQALLERLGGLAA